MAEFSKQYVEKYQPDMGWDFDIEEVSNQLDPNHYVPMICEGFGFIAIGKMDDNCMLAMPVDDAPYGTVIWKAYEQIVK